MRLRECLALLLSFATLATHAASAQSLLQDQFRSEIMQAFELAPKQSSLPCQLSVLDFPRPDFLFRHLSGYEMTCKLKDPMAPGAKLHAFSRITPQQSSPTLMVENFVIPQLPAHEANSIYARPDQLRLNSGGGFALGPGKYKLEILLVDDHNHSVRAEKTVTVREGSSLRRVSSPLQPGAVASLMFPRWDGTLAAKGPRVTILINVYSQRRTVRLQPWEIADLMQSLDSLLKQIPFRSVRLIAFDLDRQKEIFHQDSFDANGFSQLERNLRDMNLFTISAQSLKQGAWLTYLLKMAQREFESSTNPDAVIFLGEWGSHSRDKFTKQTFQSIENSSVRAFDLAFFDPFEWNNDAISELTLALRGKIFYINSPEMLADALRKLPAQITNENSK